ncbi:MAG TPA: FecR domain-containing protein [Pseudobacter sp.]|nr:FecR domain-containing protein [Pseudobacter sp.]
MKQLPEDLIRKYLEGSCTEEEQAIVESWHQQLLASSDHLPSVEEVLKVHEQTRHALAAHLSASRNTRSLRRFWPAAAAAILLLVAGIGYYTFTLKEVKETGGHGLQQAQVPAGRDGAVLTLADGSQLLLDSLGNGFITSQNGSNLSLKQGQLIYEKGTMQEFTRSFNTISTARGRQFRIVLPDGSRAWLNAASSLSYPTSFTGPAREVTITGEVYLEVMKDPSRPFVVTASNKSMRVEVLGTSFNINTYADEPFISTTLLDGSVKVSGGAASQGTVIQPGQQCQLKPGMPLRVVPADVQQVVAWKNGVFNFQDASLEKIMRQLARWYDIEVVYEQGIPDLVFEGEVNRDNSLQDVMKSLEGLGVKYRLEGKKLVVLPGKR